LTNCTSTLAWTRTRALRELGMRAGNRKTHFSDRSFLSHRNSGVGLGGLLTACSAAQDAERWCGARSHFLLFFKFLFVRPDPLNNKQPQSQTAALQNSQAPDPKQPKTTHRPRPHTHQLSRHVPIQQQQAHGAPEGPRTRTPPVAPRILARFCIAGPTGRPAAQTRQHTRAVQARPCDLQLPTARQTKQHDEHDQEGHGCKTSV